LRIFPCQFLYRRKQTLTVVAVLMDNRGGLVAGKHSEMTLDLTPATSTYLVNAGVFPIRSRTAYL
jgi:hypothetical protein